MKGNQFDNKMSSIEKVLKVCNNKYPFGENPTFSAIRVQQLQTFPSADSLQQKKSEMLRKREMISNLAIISLLSISEKGMSLIYEWQYVPHSISSYVRSKYNAENGGIWEMTRKLLVKKVTYELTMLMSYLAKMRIETELSMQTLGISHDQKLKLYMNPRSKMGIKSQLFLISHYGQAKERILKELQAELDLIQNNPDNPNFKATRPYFEGKMNHNPLLQSVMSGSSIKTEQYQKEEKKKEEIPMKRKMSSCNFDFGPKNDFKPTAEREKMQSPRTPRQHKYSFQLNNQKCQQNQSSFIQPEPERDPLINHTKSIRIELQQKQDMSPQKKRKDSYKLKITTFREYELEDASMFQQNGQNEEDIFEYFAKKARRQEQQEQAQQEEASSPRKREAQSTKAPSSPPLSPLLSHKNSSNLQERLKQARQRSQQMLIKMKSMKK